MRAQIISVRAIFEVLLPFCVFLCYYSSILCCFQEKIASFCVIQNVAYILGGVFIFYAQFEKLCEQNHIKPSALARKLGFSSSAPGRWKKGGVPQSETLRRLSEYFGVTTDYLLYGDESSRNIVGHVSNSAVVQGPSGDVSISNIVGLQDNEAELLRVFRGLDIRGQTAVLMAAYEEEEKKDKKNNA